MEYIRNAFIVAITIGMVLSLTACDGFDNNAKVVWIQADENCKTGISTQLRRLSTGEVKYFCGIHGDIDEVLINFWNDNYE